MSNRKQLTPWRKSSHSLNENACCVEVAAFTEDRVGVRDSKDPEGPALMFEPGPWQTFVDWVRTGQ
ncbi:DUF397 domain-containing protein [Kitasatospora xanthocidica]|uniref:DUF397 domain-containing protein n=1 Tax=Kitasatospora xanthocidica TaxID=83382 RepID=UPI0036E83329